MADQAPQETPPPAAMMVVEAAEETAPTQEPPAEAAFGLETITQASPSQPLPADRAATAVSAAAGATWHSDRKITGLWTINEDRNVWVGISGVSGWRKLANNSASAVVALNTLSAHAKQADRSVSAYEDDKQMISQIYVW